MIERSFYMELYINNRDDNTQNAINLMIEDMDYQDEPLVGIFWYSVQDNELFGVVNSPAMDLAWRTSGSFKADIKTDRRLHQDVWKKHHYRNEPRFAHNYMYTPRGRVFEFKDDGFKVYTGRWIEEYPQAKDLIIKEFQLPKDKTEFVQDSHWDIGHGWSQEF